MSEIVTFKFPKWLVRRAKIDHNPTGDAVVKDPVCDAADRVERGL